MAVGFEYKCTLGFTKNGTIFVNLSLFQEFSSYVGENREKTINFFCPF